MIPIFIKPVRTLFPLGSVLVLVMCLTFENSCRKEKEILLPSIDGFSPESGTEGTVVIIAGTNFSSIAANNIVKFNGMPAAVTTVTDRSLTVTVPSGASTGKISITSGGNTTSSEDNFTVFNSPVITGIEPTSGLPGATVTITGNNFSTTLTDNEIKFNNLDATVTAATGESLFVTVPAGGATGKISITVHGMTTTTADDFVVPPTLTGFLPLSGIIGSSVIISGTGFSTSIAGNIVKFNDRIASVTSATDTALTVTVPAEASTGEVTVTVSGQTAASSTDFIVVPAISAFSPAAGAIGSVIVITGTGFSSTAANNIVKVNNLVATVTKASVTALSAIVPVGAASGMITVTVDGYTALSSTEYDVEIELASAGGSGFDGGNSVALDGFGNTYVSGNFQDMANFGSSTINSEGSDDIFLAKYNSDFELEWVKRAGGTGSDLSRFITVDNSGNVYMTGQFSGTTSFGIISLTEAGGGDAFVAKFDASGDVIWAKQISSESYDLGNSVKLDASGIPYVTGEFSGTATFGTTILSSGGATDIFVAKYNPENGDVIWAKKYGGVNNQYGSSLILNSSGDIYLTGSFFGSSVFESITLTAAGGLDGFIAKLSSSGDVVWAQQISGPGWEYAISIALDRNEYCYIAGYFTGTTSFGSTDITSAGNEDIFLAKYDPSGSLIWVNKAGSETDYDLATSVATDDSGNAYITGYFSRTAAFGDIILTSDNNSRDVFVAKYNSNGNLLWAKPAGGPDNDVANSIAVNAVGTIVTCGYFRGTEPRIFGATLTIGSGNDDIFLWRIWQ